MLYDICMSEKQSIANKKQWDRVPPEERSRRMKVLIAKRYEKMSQRKKNKIGRELTAKRLAKRGVA